MTLTFEQLRERWEARRGEGERLGAIVPLAVIAAEVLADLTALHDADGDEALTLAQAARESGYHPDSLGRMIREGTLPNVGSKRRPRVPRGALPKKVGGGRTNTAKPPGTDAVARQALAGRIR